MSGQMLATVIPCFNTDAAHLTAAVESVAVERALLDAQGMAMELVVVDDCSTERGTQQALRNLEARFPWCRVVRLASNEGGSRARNHGVACTTAAWIAFLDADDLWLPSGISRLMQALALLPEVDWISGDLQYLRGSGPPDPINVHQQHPLRAPIVRGAYDSGRACAFVRPVELFLRTTLCSMGSCVIRRDTFLSVGGFDASIRKGDDTELYWRLARVATFAFAPWAVLAYRRGHDSVSNDGRALSDWEPPVLGRMLRDRSWQPYADAVRARMNEALLQMIIHHRRSGQRLPALLACAQMLRQRPWSSTGWKHLVATLTIG